MRPEWYGDKRDLVKWTVLLLLAGKFKTERILQITYFRPSVFAKIDVDGKKENIPVEVIDHFRNLQNAKNINTSIKITVFDKIFQDRNDYLKAIKTLLLEHRKEKCVVFLDPDTGLEPNGASNLNHVLETEVREIWKVIKPEDILVFYQHQTNRKGAPWVDQKRSQLANAIGVPKDSVKIVSGFDIAGDVVFYYVRKAK